MPSPHICIKRVHTALNSSLKILDGSQEKLVATPIRRSKDLPPSGTPGFPEALLLIGSEASGHCGSESLSVLFSTALGAYPDPATRPTIYVRGCIGTPEAAAAYLCSGANGVVIDSLHWLTSGTNTTNDAQKGLARMRMDHTRIVGSRLGAPCRFFDKGNSRAVNELEKLADTLCARQNSDQARIEFLSAVKDRSADPLTASYTANELIPLGPEASFALPFIERFGADTNTALTAFTTEVESLMRRGPEIAESFVDSEASRILGTEYPFIQGGMTWISDNPKFARDVADAGALPTLAAGIRNTEQMEQDFGSLPEIMDGRPYAINVLVLDENPRREEQLAWLEQHRPPFATIAAGDPSFARRLKKAGMRTIYLCPDEGLLGLALRAGVDVVVLEGNEAGGHVGAHTTQTLAQAALLMRRNEPELFMNTVVALAGGIHDRNSAFRAAMLGAQAVQMGTVYLASHEIVNTGALPELYQKLILSAKDDATSVSGETVGLRVRSLKTPRMKAILDLERQFAAGGEEESAFRKKMETLSMGTLMVATRQVRTPGGESLPPQVCEAEGQYMSGAIATCVNKAMCMVDLHRELACGELPLPQFFDAGIDITAKRSAVGPASYAAPHERIAITGMALVNSLGNDMDEFWQSSLNMKSGVTEVPASHWNHAEFFDPDPRKQNKTYSPVGAFMHLDIGRKDLWVSPQDFRTMCTSTRMTLLLASRAVEQAGLAGAYAPERISVIVSQNSGEASGTLKDQMMHVFAHEISTVAAKQLNLTPDQTAQLEDAIRAGRTGVDDTTLIGRLNCTAGGHISNRYGFMGPSYSVGAACATSLVALHAAVMMVRQGLIDAAVVGGGEERLSPAHYLEFSGLGALAGLKGTRPDPTCYSRPFDKDRDGFVMGEGGAMIVIERESTAKARGAKPLGYITGVGAANNDKGIVESVAESQIVALNASFADAGYGPEQVDFVNCHATSTMQGDYEEVTALKRTFPKDSQTVLCGLKSQIGHTLGASGLTAVIHSCLAMRDGVFPGTLNVDTPDPEIAMFEHGFRVFDTPRPWPTNRPRRSQVNAFGFGGPSFVVQLEGTDEDAHRVYTPDETGVSKQPQRTSGFETVRTFRVESTEGAVRLATCAGSSVEARSHAQAALSQSSPLREESLRKLARKRLYGAFEGTVAPTAALVFSGQGGFYPGMGHELYKTFPKVREAMDRMAEVAEFDLLDVLFNADERKMSNTRWQQPCLFTVEYAIAAQLLDIGFEPAMVAGHSLGEFSALVVAGVLTPEDAFHVVDKRGMFMDTAAALSADPGTMIATNAPVEVINRLLEKRSMVVITNYNSPRQTVFGGHSGETLHVAEELETQGFRIYRLPVHMAFHSPIMRKVQDRFARYLLDVNISQPRIPVLSNVTGKAHESDIEAIRTNLAQHLDHPVLWDRNVQSMWLDHGARMFVEAGPGNVLCNTIGDIFEQAESLSTCARDREAATLCEVVARLWSLGMVKLQGEPATLQATAAASAASPASCEQRPATAKAVKTASTGGVLDDVIAIIMEATGYERDEIEPEMDLRQDLAIRSSRLPVIMDQAEQTFGIDIRIEDFIGVNTIMDMAERIAELSGRPLTGDGTSGQSTVEDVIAIIMETTGYERDEIEPEMDLRQDLAIRSSRLPVIMDQAEKAFGIEIRIEDFIGVNTIMDMAKRIDEVRSRQAEEFLDAAAKNTLTNRPMAYAAAEIDEAGDVPRPPVTRLGFRSVPLPPADGGSIVLGPSARVAVVSVGAAGELALELTEELVKILGVRPSPITLDPAHFDLALKELEAEEDIEGLVLVCGSPGTPSEAVTTINAVFPLLRSFLGRKNRRMCLMLHRRDTEDAGDAMLAEGVLGMQLAAALEYSSVLFRTVGLDEGTKLDAALGRALVPGGPVQMHFRDGTAFAMRAVNTPVAIAHKAEIALGEEDVVVLSGGAKGVTMHIARALSVHGPMLVLLGSSPESDQSRQAVDELRGAGADAEYLCCDVTDENRVREVMADVLERHGRIDGIVHGAGILRDALCVNTSDDDFAAVTAVKTGGIINLLAHAGDGLRFVIGLSSVAAWQGNVGQTNYCAANRAMAALLRERSRSGLAAKAIWLPPVEGTGMADQEDVRELMHLKGLKSAFVHIDELSEMFLRELHNGPADEPWVMPSRLIPVTPTTLANQMTPSEGVVEVSGTDTKRLPMIDSIERLDLRDLGLVAMHTFSREQDLWLEDHVPLVSLKYPLVSAVMALETFFESSRLLMPYLDVIGIEKAQFLDMIPCPKGVDRPTRIRAARSSMAPGSARLDVRLEAQDVSPKGRLLDSWTPSYQATVLLGRRERLLPLPDMTFGRSDYDTPQIPREERDRLYAEETGQKGSYRILDVIDGTGPGIIGGSIILPTKPDFASGPADTAYPYYVLEGFMQLSMFHQLERHGDVRRDPLPVSIGEMRFSRPGKPGERIAIRCRKRSTTDKGLTWDAEAVDESGEVLMRALDIHLAWTR